MGNEDSDKEINSVWNELAVREDGGGDEDSCDSSAEKVVVRTLARRTSYEEVVHLEEEPGAVVMQKMSGVKMMMMKVAEWLVILQQVSEENLVEMNSPPEKCQCARAMRINESLKMLS